MIFQQFKNNKTKIKKLLDINQEAFWLGWLDSNQRNARVKVWCLTAWLHPNAINLACELYY